MPRLARASMFAVVLGAAALCGSCYRARSASPGGATEPKVPRPIRVADVALEPEYSIALAGSSLTYPTGVAFDEAGKIYVVESGYSYGEDFTKPRLVEVSPTGNREIAAGEKNGPWNGVAYDDGFFYIAEGGEMEGGRILKIGRDGHVQRLVENLPSQGDHHTNGPVVGKDGFVYFGQGTFTNSGVVGEDSAMFGWLPRYPNLHDVPCADITLAGANFESKDALKGGDAKAMTGAYVPFGTKTEKGQVVKGAFPCNGAVMRVPKDGGKPELVAWGFRNPYGLAFGPDDTLYLTENGFDVRGSRPIWGAADHLFAVKQGGWYGWPDYSGGRPLHQKRFKPPGKDEPVRILESDPSMPIAPIAYFAVHSSSNGFDFSRSASFGYVGQAFVAQFGDLTPPTGKVLAPVGFRVVRVDIATGVIADFVSNKGDKNGPASLLKTGGIERPIAVRFDARGDAMYVLDFGEVTSTEQGPKPVQKTGVLWKVTRATGGGA
jgi:hypothetical protein